MRLVRFEGRQEVFACRECGQESLMLDCHLCERRAVRQLPDAATGVARWACDRCRIPKYKCPECKQGWVVPSELTGTEKGGYRCEHCQHHWPSADNIGA
jgi:transposase-like protein